MKWLLFIIFGWSFGDAAWGWTYHYSNDTMTWDEARKGCQDNFTDILVIQEQRENDYIVSILPNRTQSPYYWIGITKKHINDTWRWVGNNSTWVGEQSWAKDEPNNNHSAEFCVEIYVSSGVNRGKWNNENCTKRKFAVCYKAQCNKESCVEGRCWETINNTTCLCDPGYEGDKCQTVVECPPLSQPENGDFNCSQEGWKFSTTCHFKCHPGFFINGSANVTCEANKTWSDPQPVCYAVKCPPLSQPFNGSHTCSKEGQIFNSTCHFKCHQGFFMIGPSAVTCAANGLWTGPRPVCSSYKQALLAVAGCGALSSFFCICFCCIKYRKRMTLAQDRSVLKQPEDATSPSNDVNGGTTSVNSLTP